MTIFEIKIKTTENKSTTLSYNDKDDDLANIIHKDDTIHTLKQKIAYKMKDEGISANELYIYYEAHDYYDYINAENQMLNSATVNGATVNAETLKLLNDNITDKEGMISHHNNTIEFPTDKMNTKITFYKPLSVHCVDDDGNYDHTFAVNPFNIISLKNTGGIELY